MGKLPLKIICTHPKEQSPTIFTPGIKQNQAEKPVLTGVWLNTASLQRMPGQLLLFPFSAGLPWGRASLGRYFSRHLYAEETLPAGYSPAPSSTCAGSEQAWAVWVTWGVWVTQQPLALSAVWFEPPALLDPR